MGASIDNLVSICQKDGNSQPDIDDIRAKVDEAREREMSMLFLMNSDKKRYGNIVATGVDNRLMG